MKDPICPKTYVPVTQVVAHPSVIQPVLEANSITFYYQANPSGP